jgi:hypothetical protein
MTLMATESLLKRIRTWFSFLARWLWEVTIWFACEARLFWLMVVGVLSVAVLCFVFVPCLERQIRLISLGLQLIGFGTVAWGLREARKLFRKPTFLQGLAEWFRRFPRFGPRNTITGVGAASLGLSTASGRGRVSAGSGTPIERRVEILEQSYASLFDEVGTLTDVVKRDTDELRSASQVEAEARKAADKAIEARLDEAVVGGLHLEFVGLFFFLVGMILSAVSPEISSVLGEPASCPAVW